MEDVEMADFPIKDNDENKRLIHQTNTETDENHSIALLSAVLNNDVQSLAHLVQNIDIDILNLKYTQYDNNDDSIIVRACVNSNVSAETLDVLCASVKSRYGTINSENNFYCGWEPLHYAARAGNPEKLAILVKYLDDLDSLTYFSENALHILLEYEKSVTPFEVILYNGAKSLPCTLISQEKDYTVKCAKILIERGIDVNHTNFWYDTPLSLAVRYRFTKIIEQLLKTPYIDVDHFSEAGKSIREFLKLNNICVNILPPSNDIHENPEKILFNFLKSGNEDSFINYNDDNIKDYVELVDGENELNTCGTMLQLCFRKGFLEFLQDDSYNDTLTERDIMNTPMLSVFCSKGLRRCIEHLLNNGADPTKVLRKFKVPLLEAAAVRGYYPFVAILLQHKDSKFDIDDIFDILPKLFENRLPLVNQEIYRNHVLYLLLNKLIMNNGHAFYSLKKRKILNNILPELNLEMDDSKSDDTGNICQILALGASLTAKDKSKKMIIERIHVDILSTHLDDCIDNNMFYYNSIIQDDKSYSETKTLSYLINDDIKWELLTHPLLTYFIHNKWLRIFWFFYFILFFYGIFVCTICLYMLMLHVNSKNLVLSSLFFVELGFQCTKELIQLAFLYRLKYFKDQSNYMEMAVIISCIVSVFQPNVYSTVISILCSTTIFFMLLGQLPQFTKYTLILGSIKYFLEYACFYFFQFVSFAICFYIIFPYENDNSQNEQTKNSTVYAFLFRSLFDTLILFTGEFNERVLQPELYPVFGRVIMTIFIFCMTIILNNLLVGLIVADMDQIQKDLRLYKQVKMAGFIVRTNSLIKRLHDFKSLGFIKSIINNIHLFKKGIVKKRDTSQCQKNTFDDLNKQYLKNLRNKKWDTYDKDVLKKIYEKIKTSGDSTEIKIAKN